MGGCSLWTGPSAPRCGDTLKAFASYGLDLGEETDKKTNDLQTRLSEARNLERYVRSVEAKRKAKVGFRKPRLDNARILRGIYFIDPTNEEFKARRKLEVPMPAAMLCRTRREEYRETCSVLVVC